MFVLTLVTEFLKVVVLFVEHTKKEKEKPSHEPETFFICECFNVFKKSMNADVDKKETAKLILIISSIEIY